MNVEEAALVCAAANILAVVAEEGRHRRNRRRRIWCRDWLRRREDGGRGILGMVEHELRVEDLSAYNNFLRLNTTEFNELLSLVEERISKVDTFMRPSLSAGRKLMTTLRFLATGESFRSLMYSCRIHESTISKFIPEVCDAIYHALHSFIQVPGTEAEWESISEDFLKLWQVPNCIGAVDGKHVNFRAPRNMGSYYYNYKGHHSIILMAVADAQYKFKYIYVGVNGRVNDSVVFKESELYEALINNTLHIPGNKPLPGRQMSVPYVLLADQAFPLIDRIIKPFPQRGLSESRLRYNNRLSRGRRVVENAFGILCNRFRVLLSTINLNADKVEKIVLACCSLHNYISSNGPQHVDNPDVNPVPLEQITLQFGNRVAQSAIDVRKEFEEYFNS